MRKQELTGTTPRERRARTPEQAAAALMRLCARAEKCEADARRLMRGWGLAEADAERVLARLVGDRFIDDARYAAAYAREKTRLSGWGAYKIRAALLRKGIDRATADAALAEAAPESDPQRLQNMLARKARTIGAAAPRELKTKLIRYGLSLGYEYDNVLETASEIAADKDSCDDF